ncbi:MAG: FHA domain-containing protein, partial [Desulfohalobiaceae bacterium]
AESAGKSFKSGEWRKLSMRWCPESTRLYWQSYTALYTQADKKPQKKMDTGVHAAWLILRYSNGDICSRLYLHFRTDLNIGRDTGVDVTCMPEDYTGQNQQTGFVSRKHLSLQISGDACVLKDHSTNGTWIDRSCINKQEAELRNNQVINLGGVYCFKYEEFRDLSRLKGRLRDLQLSRQSTGTPHHTVTGIKQEMKDLPISAVCLRRLGGNSNNCQYFMVLKELDIGSNKANALVLKDDSVAGQHAKLLFQGNRVQLLDLGSSSATRLNDQDLEPYRAVDIGQRDKIQFGRIVGHIHFVRRAN